MYSVTIDGWGIPLGSSYSVKVEICRRLGDSFQCLSHSINKILCKWCVKDCS